MANKICEVCNKRIATVHITNLVGEKKEHHFCEECAKGKGINPAPKMIDIGQVLSSLIGAKSEAIDEKLGALECPRCGMTFRQFKSKGRLGCPYDYEAFKEGVVPIIEQIHHSTQHVGKVPSQAGPSAARLSALIKLRQSLAAAVSAENYEGAAELRDKISALEKELGCGNE